MLTRMGEKQPRISGAAPARRALLQARNDTVRDFFARANTGIARHYRLHCRKPLIGAPPNQDRSVLGRSCGGQIRSERLARRDG